MMISLISNRTKTAGQGRGAGAVSPLTFCSSCCCAARWRCAWRWRCRPAARCGLDVVGLLLLHCSLTARVPYVASWTRQRVPLYCSLAARLPCVVSWTRQHSCCSLATRLLVLCAVGWTRRVRCCTTQTCAAG